MKSFPIPYSLPPTPSNKGFTLIEMLVALAIIVVILAVSIAAIPQFLGARTLDAAVSDTISLLEEARQLTLASKDPDTTDGTIEGSQYGVYFDISATPHRATLFSGSSFDPVAPANAIKTVNFSGVEITGLTFINTSLKNSVVFNRLTGTTNNAGSVTFRHTRTGKQKGVGVAGQGHISTGNNLSQLGWTKKKTITLNNPTSSNIQNFPVLIRLNSSKIPYEDFDAPATAAPLPPGQSRYDLIFLDADDATELDYEIESWDESGESIIWVRVPTLQSGTDTIYMYYGKSGESSHENKAGVWGSEVYAVWHLENTNDSTINMRHLSTIGGSPTTGAGLVKNGKQFNGTNTYLATSNQDPIPGSVSFSLWFQLSALPASQRYLLYRLDSDGWGIMGLLPWITSDTNNDPPDYRTPFAYMPSGSTCQYLNSCGVWSGVSGPLVVGRWYYLTGSYNQSTQKLSAHLLFDNAGTQYTFQEINMTSHNMLGSRPIAIGAEYSGASATKFTQGTIDEVRVYAAPMSADWIKASYENQKINSTFVTIE